MNLQEYYNDIISDYRNGKYQLKGKKGITKPTINPKEFNLHALNYIIWKWMDSHNDKRWKELIDVVMIPETNNFNFDGYEFEDIHKLIVKNK